MTHDEARAQFPVFDRYAYLNAGSSGPLPRAAGDAIRARLERDLEEGRSGKAYIDGIFEARERIREGIATVLGTSAELVALTESTTRGCQVVTAGLGLGPDDEIVTTDQEHFGLLGALHASGARVVVAEADENALLAAVTPRTRLIAVSHVLWTTGRRLDLARLRRADGPPLLVDGAQSAGAIPVDLAGADFYTVSAQKWLCGPEPVGRALRPRSRAIAAWRCPACSRPRADETDGSFVAEGWRARGSTPAGSARRRSPASKLRSGCIRTGATRARPRRQPAAASCSSRSSRS